MGNNKENARLNLRVEKDLLDKYKKCVPNASKDIREYMERRVNQKTNLEELQRLRLDKIKERDLLNLEIEEIEEEIEEAKRLRHQNNLNEQTLSNALGTVRAVSESGKVKGVTRDKVTEIAENYDLKPNILIRKCKEENIKFISPKMEEVNSTIRETKKEDKPPELSLIKAIRRDFKQARIKFNDDLDKFLDAPQYKDKYLAMSESLGVNFEEVKKEVKKLHHSGKL